MRPQKTVDALNGKVHAFSDSARSIIVYQLFIEHGSKHLIAKAVLNDAVNKMERMNLPFFWVVNISSGSGYS